jgi:cyclophilin family peptidyl-prolyl cis-trans isomerase
MNRTIALVALFAVLVSACSAPAADKNPVVVVDTSMGQIKIELDAAKAPNTVKNFLAYVDGKFYDGTVFHRVIKSFMIQGGGMEPGMKEKPTKAPIRNESNNGLVNARGTIAMARTPAPDSATAQFFINLADNQFLNRAQSRDGAGYCVFGKVIEGMDVVDKIANVETTRRGPHGDVPKQDVVITSIHRVEP